MLELLTIGALAGAALAAGIGALIVRRKRRWIDRALRRRVLVHTSEDQTIDGVLMAATPDGVVLANAKFHEPDVGFAGEVWVPREKVRFLQLPEPTVTAIGVGG